MAMYFFTFRASPTSEAKEFQKAGGAYVNCWIDNASREEAEERASDLIFDYGWSVDSLEAEAVVTAEDYDEGDEDREFYQQALVDGEVLVFTTWPYGEGEPA